MKSKRMTFRMNEDVVNKLNEAKVMGSKPSEYVQSAILNYYPINISNAREIVIHISNINTILEFCNDQETVTAVREELNKICRASK